MSKEKIKKLVVERDEIDKQLTVLQEVLKSNDVDMNTELIDNEGFPKAELDIPTIRKARQSIIYLMNDRKKLTAEIDTMLSNLHTGARSDSENSGEPMQVDNAAPPAAHRTSNRPFLRVENVLYGSPAFYSGLLVDDVVIQCGPLHADNFAGLQNFSEVVGEHVGNELKITVLRQTKVHRLVAHPGRWSGAGVFGARLAVIKNGEI